MGIRHQIIQAELYHYDTAPLFLYAPINAEYFTGAANMIYKKEGDKQSMNTVLTSEENTALSFLPRRISDAVRRYLESGKGSVNEIRLRTYSQLTLTSGEDNIQCGIVCTPDDLAYTGRALCGNSLYSHTETIREGYICAANGIRAGICGRAICDDGGITAVTDISSICIRIHRRVIGAGDKLCRALADMSFRRGILVYAKPGGGKTTSLREMMAELSTGTKPMRIAVVDTRYELTPGIVDGAMIDALCGYPRAKGIEIALRTLSPQLIVCDEIGSDEDEDALMASVGAGVPVAASIHAATKDELLSKPSVRRLADAGVFGAFIGISRCGGEYSYDVASFRQKLREPVFSIG